MAYLSTFPSRGAYRFLLGDDRPYVRIGVRHILATRFHDAEITEAPTAADILLALERDPYDVLVLDLMLPDRSGVDLMPDLKRWQPQLRILVLSVMDEGQMGVRLMRAGADGYLTKETASEQLITAVSLLLAGHKFVSPRLAEYLARALDASAARALHDALSPRELQVMRLLAAGHTASEIAAMLNLDVRTIGTFRRNILHKLQLHTTNEIIHYAYRHGLVT